MPYREAVGFIFVVQASLGNSYFDFRQFRVTQQHAAMRVSTDACLFGAWIQLYEARQVLDIGTGTGLLALMLAQRFPDAHFTAVEIESGACADAVLNFHSSPWKSRLELHQQDVRCWRPEQRFEAIVCNPPFFIRDLPNPQESRKLARHGQDGLHPEALLEAVDSLLQTGGMFYVMLPPPTMQKLEALAGDSGLHIQRRCRVRHTLVKQVHLEFAVFSKAVTELVSEEEIILKDGDSYSSSAAALLAPYYLFLKVDEAH